MQLQVHVAKLTVGKISYSNIIQEKLSKFLDLQGECPCVQYSPGFLFYVSYLERWKIGTAICCFKW